MKHALNQLISVLISILLFLGCIVTAVLFQTNASLKSNYIQRSIQRMTITTTGENGTVSSPIFSDTIDEIYLAAEENNIPKEFVDSALNSTEVKNFFGTIIGETIDQVVNGKAYDPITKQELDQLIEENVDRFAQNSGQSLTVDQKKKFVSLAKSYSQKIIDSIPTSEQIINHLDAKLIENVQTISSDHLRNVCLLFTIAFAIVLVPLKWKHQKWLLFQAIPVLCASIVIIAIGCLLPGMSDIFLSAEYSLMIQFSNIIFSSISLSMLIIAGVMIGIGIMEIIVYYIFKNMRLKKQQKNVAQS